MNLFEKQWTFRFLISVFLASVTFYAAPLLSQDALDAIANSNNDSVESYRMGPGDRIKILVFGEEELTMETSVGESGLISYPFLGELRVQGKTQLEFEREIAEKLKEGYLVNPEVTVAIAEYRKFFIDGHVKSPGGYEFQPGMTVRKAVSVAGGFGPRADRDKIYVVRGGDEEKQQVRIGIDAAVGPGDVITVDRSFF